jgi:uncharacterized protein (DUF1501 family)
MSFTRRQFLQASLGASTLVSLGPTVPSLVGRTAQAAGPPKDAGQTILVVVQLAGGNDGLNTLVPYEDDLYAKARPTLRLAAAGLHKVEPLLGFHPELSGFYRLYREGLLSVVEGVGYPNPHGGHFESMHCWQGAQLPDNPAQTGWIGRTVDRIARPDEARTPAVYVGHVERPFTLNARESIIPWIRSADDWSLRLPPGPNGPAHRRRLLESAEPARPSQDNPLADFLRRSTLGAYASQRQIEEAMKAESKPAVYPRFQFAAQLALIARLIRAELGVRIFYTELGGQEPGGFDTHASQAANHGALLRQLSDSIAAFLDDLRRDKLADRVLLVTFSEFGRTVYENGRRGTDHGSSQPIFLAGGRVRGGLIGRQPPLDNLEGGGQRHHTDFRRLYATLLDRWLGIPSQPILGAKYPPLDLLRA